MTFNILKIIQWFYAMSFVSSPHCQTSQLFTAAPILNNANNMMSGTSVILVNNFNYVFDGTALTSSHSHKHLCHIITTFK